MEMQYTLGIPDGVLESKSNREAGHLFSLTLTPVEVHHCTRNGDVPVATFDISFTISVDGHGEDDTRPKCNKYNLRQQNCQRHSNLLNVTANGAFHWLQVRHNWSYIAWSVFSETLHKVQMGGATQTL